jgi:L-lactate dehydrogenase complex protein LldE
MKNFHGREIRAANTENINTADNCALTVGLFIPCYVDQFYPHVAVATLELLEKLGCVVVYPPNQTCCGQPMANSGFASITQSCSDLFLDNFSGFDYIVCPSGSCVLHAREHVHKSEMQGHGAFGLHGRIFELTEFLVDVLQVKTLPARFAHRVGLHQSCHGQRGLNLSQMSELVGPQFSKPEALLRMVEGIELITLDRPDECCGFGGSFCVAEEAVSVKMGVDRVADHARNKVEYMAGGDMSCLMHLDGILKRQGSAIQIKHIAEILNAGWNQ